MPSTYSVLPYRPLSPSVMPSLSYNAGPVATFPGLPPLIAPNVPPKAGVEFAQPTAANWLALLQPNQFGQPVQLSQPLPVQKMPGSVLSSSAPGRFNPMPTIHATSPLLSAPPVWKNDLKQLFHRNEAVIYALNIRTFGAFDKNGDGKITPGYGENGTFLSAAKRLDELTRLGVNTIHLLPINPIGQSVRLGKAGSLYAPSDYHSLNPEFKDKSSPMTTVLQEAQAFVQECHKRGIRVMVDVPSCASIDLAKKRPDLLLKDATGKPLVPTNWVDIVMLVNDSPALRQYFQGFFDLMNQVGVDGFRVDVARARSVDFWKHFIGKYPDRAWLAESYCEEDQSPLKNLPRDIPETLLKSGFDSIYGQFHIFPSMLNSKEYIDYLKAGRAMFQRASMRDGSDKSFIGSYLTHDDASLMEKGGSLICLLSAGLMATQPWTNPYILDGFTTGYKDDFDIFNYDSKPTGKNPEIGLFLQHMLALRKRYAPVLTQGRFIPLEVEGNPDNQVIAFARQANTPQGVKTLLVIANKDINAIHEATLKIPGLSSSSQITKNLAPEYGEKPDLTCGNEQLKVRLSPGKFSLFEINVPELAQKVPAY